MKKVILSLTLLIGILHLTGCAQASPQPNPKEITICAAVSLREALEEIKPKFEKSKNIRLILNFAASGTLQKQIEEGAPADLFISAGKKQMDALEEKNLVDKDSRRDLLKNKLALIVSKEYKDKVATAADLVNLDARISIGDPDTVPAGQYAKESLTNMSLWDSLTGKMVLAKDIGQVLAYVERGEAAAGIVYATDAIWIEDGFIVETLDESTHSPIVYPMAIVSASKDKTSAKLFVDYLVSDEAQQIFKKNGFSIIGG